MTQVIGLIAVSGFLGVIITQLPKLYRDLREVRDRWDDDSFWDDDYLKEL